MDGRVQLFHDSTVPGPYKKTWREHWLRWVLEVQQAIRDLGPPEVQEIQLISMDELHEIRRIWLYEKREFDDSLPRIYEEVTGERFPRPASDDHLLRLDDWNILHEICGDDEAFFELQVGLLDIEREFRGMTRRAGIYQALEDRLRACQYASEDEAIAIRQEQEQRRQAANEEQTAQSPLVVQQTLFDRSAMESPCSMKGPK